MRILLLGTVVCLTAGAFFGAERLISSDAKLAEIEQKAATQAAIDAQLKTSNQAFLAEIAALKDAGAASAKQIGDLTDAVQSLTAQRDDLSFQLITTKDEASTTLDRLTEVEAANAGLVDRTAAQEAAIAEKEAELDALRETLSEQDTTEVAALTDELKARDDKIASLEAALDTANAAQSDAPNADIEELTAAHAAALADANVQIATLTDALATAENELGARDEAIAALETELNAKETEVVADTAADPSDAAPAPSQAEQIAQIAALDAQIADLTQVVEKQTSAIANLRLGFGDGPVEPMEMAEVCIERASRIIEASQITFGTGTASISEASMETLDHLRDLAIGCENNQMILEIGGHTDSRGAQADNQRLSEARAQRVKEFLSKRGIPAENMIAIGFGETNPVASNDTPAGRAENRRITFMWQMREEAEPVEQVSDTVGGY